MANKTISEVRAQWKTLKRALLFAEDVDIYLFEDMTSRGAARAREMIARMLNSLTEFDSQLKELEETL